MSLELATVVGVGFTVFCIYLISTFIPSDTKDWFGKVFKLFFQQLFILCLPLSLSVVSIMLNEDGTYVNTYDTVDYLVSLAWWIYRIYLGFYGFTFLFNLLTRGTQTSVGGESQNEQ